MKICSVICEFNPFHNGHKYLLQRAREESSCDYLLCIMSGNFTQRGDIAVADKYTRAKHAILGGADCVLELPVAFSVAPAEIFAKGAVKLISSVPSVSAVAFGCETADKNVLSNSAKLLYEESADFKSYLTGELKTGQSFIKSYHSAFEKIGGKKEVLQKPNNILAIEYIKALYNYAKTDMEIFPIKRIGADFNDIKLKENFSSASAIRQNLHSPQIKNNVPSFVFTDLKNFSKENELYERFLKLILSRTAPTTLKNIYGCGEGLENAIKNLENLPFRQIIDNATSKRYASSRIKRILCANFLGLYKNDCEIFLKSDLYLTPLAVKKQCINIFSELAKSNFPLLISGSDIQKLSEPALKCKKLDDFSLKQWQQINGISFTPKMLII